MADGGRAIVITPLVISEKLRDGECLTCLSSCPPSPININLRKNLLVFHFSKDYLHFKCLREMGSLLHGKIISGINKDVAATGVGR